MMVSEETSLDYIGNSSTAEFILRLLNMGLLAKTFDKRHARKSLAELMISVFEGDRISLSRTSEGFSLSEVNPTPRIELLKAQFKRHLGRPSFQFLYDESGVERSLRKVKVFPWGIRGLTAEGPRNFSWTKVHTQAVELPRKFRVEVHSLTSSNRRVFTWRLFKLSQGGIWIPYGIDDSLKVSLKHCG